MCSLSNLKFLESLWKILLWLFWRRECKVNFWLLYFFPTLLWYPLHNIMRVGPIIFTASLLVMSSVHMMPLVKQRQKANDGLDSWLARRWRWFCADRLKVYGYYWKAGTESPLEFCWCNGLFSLVVVYSNDLKVFY